MSIVDKQFFSIDSGAGDHWNGSKKSKISFTFANLVQRRDGLQLCRLGIDHGIFPVSWYVVNESNARIHFLDEWDDTNHDLQIPEGNYTARQLCAQLMSMYGYWTLSVSDVTGRVTITPAHLIRIFADSTCYALLGLEEGENYLRGPGEPLECPFPCNLFGTQRLIVRAPDVPCPNQDVHGQGFLLSLPANAAPFEEIVYTNDNGDGCILPPEFTTDQITIHIVDDGGNYVDFNNVDWSIVLFVEYTMAQMDDRIWSLSDVLRGYETQLVAAIEQKKKKPSKHAEKHKYNTRAKNGKKKAKDR